MTQILRFIDVAERFCDLERPAQRRDPPRRLGRHGIGAPCHVVEQAAVEPAQAEQDVAAVLGRVKDGVVFRQRGGRAGEAGSVEGGAVGADEEDRTRFEAALRGAGEPRAEIAFALRRQSEARTMLEPGRGVGIAAQLHREAGGERLVNRPLQHLGGEAGGALGPKRGDEAGLHPAGDRLLGEDDDPGQPRRQRW